MVKRDRHSLFDRCHNAIILQKKVFFENIIFKKRIVTNVTCMTCNNNAIVDDDNVDEEIEMGLA